MAEKFNVKIAKTATLKSIMDITSSLDYHQTKKDEEVYKGKIIFSITERDKGNYLKAFMDKATAKVLFNSISSHTFTKIFGDQGMTDFGGSVKGTDVRSRIFNIKAGQNKRGDKQYIFTIQEGPGIVDKQTGSIKMKGRPEISVQTYVGYIEALKMAYEVIDFIHQKEIIAMQQGKPLFTLSYYNPSKTGTDETSGSSYNNPNKDFIIPAGEYKGKELTRLSNKELIAVFNEVKETDEEKLKRTIADEIRKRKREKSAG